MVYSQRHNLNNCNEYYSFFKIDYGYKLFFPDCKNVWVLPSVTATYENALNLLDINAFVFASPFLNPVPDFKLMLK